MPAPPVVSAGPTLTQMETGSPAIQLDWSHAGTNLDRFEIAYRKTGSGASFKTLVVVAKASVLVSGTNYRLITASPSNAEWVVVPLDSTGLRPSGTNPTVQAAVSMDGVWLMPLIKGVLQQSRQVWIGGASPEAGAQRQTETFEALGRQAKVSQSGRLFLDEGEITGKLMAGYHLSLDADGLLTRLKALVDGQAGYSEVRLVSPRYFKKVELNGVHAAPSIAGGQAWDVSAPWREIG
jgi:hypothetical protein